MTKTGYFSRCFPLIREGEALTRENLYAITKGRESMIPPDGRKSWLGLIAVYILTLLVVSLSVAVAEWRTSESVLALAGDRATVDGPVILINPATGQILGSSSAANDGKWMINLSFGSAAQVPCRVQAADEASGEATSREVGGAPENCHSAPSSAQGTSKFQLRVAASVTEDGGLPALTRIGGNLNKVSVDYPSGDGSAGISRP